MTLELTPHIQAQLEKLKDIRLPEPVAWWPLAPGWWILSALFLLAIGGFFIWSFLRRRTVRFVALKELKTLRDTDSFVDYSVFSAEVSALLRRVAIRRSGHSISRLTGKDWINYLCKGKDGMTQQMASILARAPYALTELKPAAQAGALTDAAELWIRRHT